MHRNSEPPVQQWEAVPVLALYSYRKGGRVLVIWPLHGEKGRNKTLNVDNVPDFQKSSAPPKNDT